ncbi:adenosine deaminase, partial [Schumannella luteola]
MSDGASAHHHVVDGIDLRALPKVSLHDHLDGGLRPQTIIELAEPLGLELPASDADSLAAWFAEKSDSGSLVEYLKTFDLTTAVMQTAEGLTRVSREFVEDLAADGVVWGEIRWAPEQHLARGLSLDEAVEAVQRGLDEGVDAAAEVGHGIRVGQLI